MTDTSPDRYTLEQTRILGRELGIPMDALMDQVGKALGISQNEDECDAFVPPTRLDEDQPAETSSNLLTGQNRKCASMNRFGQPCGAYRRIGSQLCAFHDPNLADELREARSEGGRRSPYRLPLDPETNLEQVPLHLNNRLGLQASMEGVMRMILLGRIPARHATVLMRYFNGAIRNLSKGGFADYQRIEYDNLLREILLACGLIERDLEEQARNNRIDQISDVGSKREEVLQANQKFGYLPPSKTKAAPARSPGIGYGPDDIRPFYG